MWPGRPATAASAQVARPADAPDPAPTVRPAAARRSRRLWVQVSVGLPPHRSDRSRRDPLRSGSKAGDSDGSSPSPERSCGGAPSQTLRNRARRVGLLVRVGPDPAGGRAPRPQLNARRGRRLLPPNALGPGAELPGPEARARGPVSDDTVTRAAVRRAPVAAAARSGPGDRPGKSLGREISRNTRPLRPSTARVAAAAATAVA